MTKHTFFVIFKGPKGFSDKDVQDTQICSGNMANNTGLSAKDTSRKDQEKIETVDLTTDSANLLFEEESDVSHSPDLLLPIMAARDQS